MIACKKCGTEYEDRNTCDLSLTDDSGESLEKDTKIAVGDIEQALSDARKVTSVIHRVLGWLYFIFLALSIFTLFVLGAAEIRNYLFLVVFLVPATIHLVAAEGLVRNRTWARPLSIVIGFILLIGFPVGTMLGGIILFQMLRKEWGMARENRISTTGSSVESRNDGARRPFISNKSIGYLLIMLGVACAIFSSVVVVNLMMSKELGLDSGIYGPVIYAILALAPVLFLCAVYSGVLIIKNRPGMVYLIAISVLGVCYSYIFYTQYPDYPSGYLVEKKIILTIGGIVFVVLPLIYKFTTPAHESSPS